MTDVTGRGVRVRRIQHVLCDSCRRCHSVELVDGRRRRCFCDLGHGWVTLRAARQCMHHEPRTKG